MFFYQNPLKWVQNQKLTASFDADPAGDRFGVISATSQGGQILAIGAYGDEENGDTGEFIGGAGAVYIFQSSSLGYQQIQKLTASGDADPAGDRFGNSLSFSETGNFLVIGAYDDEENGGTSAGSVYIFQSSSLGYQQVQKLTASGDADPAGDNFGSSVSINQTGDTLVIAADRDEENGGTNAGSVYIFQSSSLGYQQVQKLTASGDSNPAVDLFGIRVSMNSTGDTIVIGASGDEENGGTNAGSVYIFQSSSLGYQQVQKLTASGDANPAGDVFGIGVSMNSTGDTIVIGAYGDEENGYRAGSVYIFQSGSQGYQQVQKLTASGDADPADDWFGRSISMNSTGDTLVIGAYFDEENGGDYAGSVYIFQSSSLGYQQVQKVTASFGTDGQPEVSPERDWFGSSVSMNSTGDTIVIGAQMDEENGGNTAGAVYIFQSGSQGYQQAQKLTANREIENSRNGFGNYGICISINENGDTVAIGGPLNDENGYRAGAIYVFSVGSDGYQQIQKLTASGDADPAEDRFGWSVSMNTTGDTVAIGARRDEENGTNAGSVYIFNSGSQGYQQVQKLTASFGTDGQPEVSPESDYFGESVFMNAAGDILAIGARYDEENGGNNAGAVYIFQSGSQGYQQIQKLTASFGTDGQPEVSPEGDNFGRIFSMNSAGDTLAIGASTDEENGGTNAGSVYIFQSSSLGYQQVQKLTASGDAGPSYDAFGFSVSMNSTGNTIVVGAYNDEENGGQSAGSAYIFQSSSVGYQQVQKLTASFDSDPAYDAFGFSVSMNSTGNTIVVGAYWDEENGGTNDFNSEFAGAGSAYIFRSGSQGYEQVQKLTARGDADPTADGFGNMVVINKAGDTVAIAAHNDEESGGSNDLFSGHGSVYIFKLTRDY